MKSSTQDQVESKIHKVKGEIKEIAGKHINNPDLEREGKDEKIAGIKHFFHNFLYHILLYSLT